MNVCPGQIGPKTIKGFSTKDLDSRLYLALNVIGVLWHLDLKPSIGTCSFHHWKIHNPTINSRILIYKDTGLNESILVDFVPCRKLGVMEVLVPALSTIGK